MKGKKILWCVVCSVMTVIMAFAAACTPEGGGGNGDPTDPVKKVTEGDKCIDLEIVRQPNKTEYKSGESFKSAGLIFNAIYENGFTGDYNLTGGDLDGYSPKGPLTEDVTEIILKFEGFEKALPITVLPKTLLSMNITREPDVKSYEVGETLDLTGLTVAAEYEEGLVENETNYTITDKNGNVYEQGTVLEGLSGSVELTVSVKSGEVTKSDTFTISVFSGITVQAEDVWIEGGETERPVDKSYTVVKGNNLKLEFIEGNKGTHLKNDSKFTGSGYFGDISQDTIKPSLNKYLTIEFHIYSAVEMKNADIVLIASSVVPSKEVSKKMDDMQVNKVFEVYHGANNSQIYIGDDVIIEGKAFPPADSGTTQWTNWVEVNLCKLDIVPGDNVVTLKCINTIKGADNWGRAPNIDKLEVRAGDGESVTGGDWVTGVTVNKQPTKTTYAMGETFDPTGLEFAVTYRNGYTGDSALGASDVKVLTETLAVGVTEVTLQYKNYTFKVPVTVSGRAVTGVEITRQPTVRSYAKGNALNLEGLTVKATYEGGYTDDNVTGYTVKDASGKVYTTGTALDGTYSDNTLTLTVEVSSGGATKSATFTVTVFSGITVEAEAKRSDSTGATESYTLLSGGYKINANANAATAVEDIQIGFKIEFYVYSETAVTGASLVLRACSVDRKTDGSGTYDTPFNEVYKLSYGENDTQVQVDESVVIAGRQKVAGETNLWFIWTENVIATVDLQAGYNKITLECIGKHKDTDGGSDRVPNIDRIDIKF